MNKKSFPITRSTNLFDPRAPKVRITKDYYLSVTEASKDSLLKRLKPAYRVRHMALLWKLEEMLTEGFQNRTDIQLRKVVHLCESKRNEHREKLAQDQKANKTRTAVFTNQARQFRISTLEMMLEMGKLKLVDIARTGGIRTESLMREFFVYADALDCSGEAAEDLLNEVREATPEFALEDLTELTGEDREAAIRIIQAARLIRAHEKERDTVTNLFYADINKGRFISSDLAGLVISRPEAVGSLSEYIDYHPVPVTAGDVSHFKEFLDTPATALFSGAL